MCTDDWVRLLSFAARHHARFTLPDNALSRYFSVLSTAIGEVILALCRVRSDRGGGVVGCE